MPTPRADPQRDNLYYLEAEINGSWAYSSGTTHRLEMLVLVVSKYYGVEGPKLRVVRDKKCSDDAWYIHDDETIFLNRSREGANGMVLMHEMAHYLVDCFYAGVTTTHHGPEFCAIYMHLLDHFCFLPHRCFRLMAKTHRLKIARRYRPIAFK